MTFFPNFLTSYLPGRPATEPTSHKRKAEEELDGPVNKNSRQNDLRPIFECILSAIISEEGAEPPDLNDVVAELSENDEVMFSIYNTPPKKIKECFKKFMLEFNVSYQDGKRIGQTVSHLYPVSLVASSTNDLLESMEETTPLLKEKLRGEVIEEIRKLLRDSRGLIREANFCTSLPEINSMLLKIDRALLQLSEYRELRQRQDKEENRHILDLALYYKKTNAETQYPNVISDYSSVVQMIKPLSGMLAAASRTASRLCAVKLQLQGRKASYMQVERKEDPLEARFLNAFSKTFYFAFASHFWFLLWKSQDDPEVESILREIPDWGYACRDIVNETLVASFWEKYLPEFEMQKWILAILKEMDPKKLDRLESALQSEVKQFNIVHENSKFSKATKTVMERPHLHRMDKLCFAMTKTRFSTLKELKNFLTAQKEK
jgi:hypothetical protein